MFEMLKKLFRWLMDSKPPLGRSKNALLNFSPRAQQTLALARLEADRLTHNFVGTEHLLLGLIKLRRGIAARVLQKMGLDFEIIRQEIEKQMGGSSTSPKIIGNNPFTIGVKKTLALAGKEAESLNHTYVGTEHILLGLLREEDGIAARVLKSFQVTFEKTHLEILKELDPNINPEENSGPK